jgi:hypothetical protein
MVSDKKYFRSELLAVLLTAIVLLGLLWIAHFTGLIVINFTELLIYTILSIVAGFVVLMIRWYGVINRRR